ncbi:energy transducer TonB [Sphingomonas sp. PR090111-T3T-6A]|uniref:energy transducer TonB n=1 Tax=Sphingomonas sp. PR090111-T3T-6A TaxID=685778 RepID=UPI00037EB41A|nr:energy transducer TonB [Sphingomonas sp. PR090111-T3T-6A]
MGNKILVGMIGGALLASAAQAGSGPRPVNNPGDWITSSDYPTSALQTYVAGTTGFRLDIGSDGNVAGCTITLSSGTSALDDATCALLRVRARFTPATDARGHAIASAYSSKVVWQIPDGAGQLATRRFLTCLANDRETIQVETPFGCNQ